MEHSLDRRDLQKRRIMRYFIEATVEIIDKEGLKGVTIRKVADIAGYNSATLYNYFDDLNHLLFMATLTYVNEYIAALPSYIGHVKNAEEMYLSVWDCFLDYSFQQPSIYRTWFFSKLKSSVELYVQQFYSLYPLDNKKFPPEIQRMFLTASARQRTRILIDDCISQGFINPKYAEPIVDITLSTLETLLIRVEEGNIQAGPGKEKCREYIHMIYSKMRR
ncbi:MAG: TetR/AcrR family transcriptional regulator [Tissierellia bacterium]|nr:TetR/AcrR family transcriptional regulator [Tissierellia bacterium]